MSFKRSFYYSLPILGLCFCLEVYADALDDLRDAYQRKDNTAQWLTDVVSKSETLISHVHEYDDVVAKDLLQLSEESDEYASTLYTVITGYTGKEQIDFLRKEMNRVSRALLLLAKKKAQEEKNDVVFRQTKEELEYLSQEGISEEDIASDIESMSSAVSTPRSDRSSDTEGDL